MEYYSAIKKNAFESVLMRWMKLEPIIQSEVSQKEKHQYSILLFFKKHIFNHIFKEVYIVGPRIYRLPFKYCLLQDFPHTQQIPTLIFFSITPIKRKVSLSYHTFILLDWAQKSGHVGETCGFFRRWLKSWHVLCKYKPNMYVLLGHSPRTWGQKIIHTQPLHFQV